MIEITRINPEPFGPGLWIAGVSGELEFNALVSREPAIQPGIELLGSRITKMWILREVHTVFSWDQGPDIESDNEEVKALVQRLCSELADQYCFGVANRIRLVEMVAQDPFEPGKQGQVAEVLYHQDWMQVNVDWDCGNRLMLIVPPDRAERVKRDW